MWKRFFQIAVLIITLVPVALLQFYRPLFAQVAVLLAVASAGGLYARLWNLQSAGFLGDGA